MATWIPEKKISETISEEIKFPWDVIADPPTIPSKTSQLTNNSGFLTSHQDISGKANLSGGNTFSGNQVITGYLDIRGTAAEKHLKTRGIGGSDGNGTSSDLYLQYSSDYKTYFGKTAQSSLNADGSISINGKTAATTDQIPNVSGKANLSGGNTFTGQQIFNNTVGSLTNQLVLNETQWDIFTCRDLTSPTTKTAVGKGSVWCQDSDSIYSQFKATGIYYGNDTSGYEGTLKFPTNISGEKTIATTDQIPTFSLSGTTLTITLP